MARSFNGSSDKITGNLPSTQVTPVTLAVWVNPTTLGNSNESIITYGDESHTGWGIEQSNNGGGGGTAGQWGLINYGVSRTSSGSALSTGTWFHLAITVTNGGNVVFYQNGVSVGTASAITLPVAIAGSSFIGTDGNVQFTNCVMADKAIWTVILTAGEVLGLARGMRPYLIRPASLVKWMPIDGIQSPEPDFSGQAKNGTLTGTSFANGPPFSMFTSRAPLILPATTAAAAFQAAWAMRNRIVIEGIGI